MSWVVWRQYRAAAAITAALVAAFAALVVVTGVQAASQWHSALAACTASRTCGNLSSSTLFLGSHAIGFLVIMTLGVPAVLGILAGAPLLAHEFETGTNQYAWTQSVTRRRWLAVKTGWLLLAAAAIGGIVSALVTWWSGPNNALQANAFDPGRFDIMGIVPVGYAVFATALGITAGALLRRTLPAIAVTLAGFIAVRAVIFMLLRSHFMTAVTSYFPINKGFSAGSAWQLAAGFADANGQPIILPQSTNGAVIGSGTGNAAPGHCPAGPVPGGRGRRCRRPWRVARARCLPCRGIVRAGARHPRLRDVPAGLAVLGVPGHRDGDFPAARRGADRGGVRGRQPPGRVRAGRVTTGPFGMKESRTSARAAGG